MKMRILFIFISCFIFTVAPLYAAPPATLTYQGELVTAQGVRVNGTADLTFRIYDVETGGVKLWEEAHPGATVVNGIFTVILGKITSMASLPFDKTYYMSLEPNGSGEMAPRIEMSSAPYAMNTVKQTSGGADAFVKSITIPENVTVSASGSGQTTVSWNAVKGATSYNLYLATETGVNASNYTSKTNGRQMTGVTSPYTVTGLTNGTQYFFSVASVTPVGESTASLEANATPAAQITNTLGMIFKPIPAGTFTMGCSGPSASGEPCSSDGREVPVHQVTISPFYMQTTEVTQGQWKAVMGGANPSYFPGCGDNCPVEQISWTDIQTFLTTLNGMGQGTYRLPTEAEWEYAARAGATTAWAFGDNSNILGNYAWYTSNSGSKTNLVAQKLVNAWGLYDMYGNVWEWVSDWYGSYSSAAATDPVGPSSGSFRVFRGGSWHLDPAYVCSAFRDINVPGFRNSIIGFRLARTNP